MAVKLRLTRIGKTGNAQYRLIAIDEHKRRGGRAIEVLGSYNPHQKVKSQKLKVKSERIKYWLSVGAKPTETVAQLLK
ncbi:MAG: 30S ribosomal protein S16 [Patescibacteria group bacterium]|nr:30S ribosomal protein S16 [Patescibacteria group bacterium]MCL5432076.1 30S ribosomal protein S16 [Patescibacteria group bacterium]